MESLQDQERQVLLSLLRKRNLSNALSRRAKVLVDYLVENKSKSEIARDNAYSRPFINRWLDRWQSSKASRKEWFTTSLSGVVRKEDEAFIISILSDEPRSGAPAKFSDSVKEQLVALAITAPRKLGLPFDQWSHELLSREAVRRGIVESISSSRVGDFLKGTSYKTTQE